MMKQQNHRPFKNALYEQFARLAKALANPHRLELVDLLAQGERTVEQLARESAMSVANTSQHLQSLRAAQLVEVRREGLYGYYRLADERVFRLWQALRDLGELRLAEIDRVVEHFLEARETMKVLTLPELLARLDDNTILVLDVRPPEEYRAGHIPGALSFPLEVLEQRLGDLPRDKEIVAYCRGPYCVFSDEAVAFLQEQGYRARRLAQGLPDWRSAGFPVQVSQEG